MFVRPATHDACVLIKPRVLYCPGLDGYAHELQGVSETLRGKLVLDILEYPEVAHTDFQHLADAAAERLKARPKGKRLIAGCSFGGAVALTTALDHPDLVDGLFLGATFNHEPARFSSAIGRLASRLLPEKTMRAAVKGLAAWKLTAGAASTRRKEFLKMFDKLDMQVLAGRLEMLRKWDVRSKLKKLRMPVEVIYGLKDPIGGAKSQVTAWGMIPDCEIVALPTGHIAASESPGLLADLLLHWVRRTRR